MRKILTAEEIASRDKRRNQIITIVLLLILLISSAGYAFTYRADNQNAIDPQSNKVQNYGNQWVVNWGGTQHVFSSSPESSFNATELDFAPDISKYYNKPLYIYSKSDIISNEIAVNLGVYAERTNRACYEDYEDCEKSDWPTKNCTDNLIVYTSANENKITQEDNCIFIEGDIRAVDAFLYREIGIA